MATVVLALLASGCGSSSGESSGTSRGARASGLSARTLPLAVVEAPTPRFQVPRYDTSGTYPRVRDRNLDLSAVNAALREAVLADQREFAPGARRYSIGTAKRFRGVYETSVDRRLLAASTVVVSALMPATTLYPGGSHGKTWVAMTIRVPSGEPVMITDLFADPPRGLRVLARAWKTRATSRYGRCVAIVPSDYRPTAHNYRHFALTVHGLAVGFLQPPSCNRLQATVPYAVLRPHLSKLGATLVTGVRRPR